MNVFLSSTFDDLKEYRALASRVLEQVGGWVSRMEIPGVTPAEAVAHSLAEVAKCDLFVGIYAHRYGCVPSEEEFSITEQEFDCARRLVKPIICFVIQQGSFWPQESVEGEPGRTKLLFFKAKVRSLVRVDVFETPEDFVSKLAARVTGDYVGCAYNVRGQAI